MQVEEEKSFFQSSFERLVQNKDDLGPEGLDFISSVDN
jgi:hypothetical protein